MAASIPKVCMAPSLVAHGTWKYGTLKPPSWRNRLKNPETSPCGARLGVSGVLRKMQPRQTYRMVGEAIVNIRVCGG